MYNTKICRVCLSIDRRMCAVTDTVLQEMWEKLTNTNFNTIDGKPLLVCYICCAQLTRSHQLMRRALKAEELLTTFISNGLEQSKELISLMASQLNEFEYNCSIEHQPGVEIIQYEINKEEDIKEEKEQDIEIYIKEEVEGTSDSNHEMNADSDSVSEKDSDSDLPLRHMSLKNLLERKVELNFPKTATGTPARKRKLSEIPQKVKRIKLNERTNDKSIANAVLKIEEASDHEVLDISFSENSLVSNAAISERKLTSEQCSQINNISPKLNIRPKENTRTKNEILQEDIENAENKVFNLPKSESAVTPGTSIDGSDKGNKTNMSNMKGPKRYFSCHTCQYKSVKKIEFIRHLLKHTGEKPYMCDVCGYKCALKSSLNVHIKHKHTKEKQYSCALCPYKGATRNALNRHNYKHTGEKPYICDICNHKFTQLGNLKSHINNKHTKEKKFTCYICQRTFFVKSLLDKHLRKHTGEKPYMCDLCDFRCSGQGNLKRHKKQKHTKEMNFSCHICQHAFVEKSHLQRHLRNHTGEKPYMCDLCDFKCSDRGYLKRHKMYKHTNERNFSCHICQYKFVVKIDLDRHLRKHTGEKPHTCKICGYKCSYPSGLASHIKSKHSK